MSKYLITSRTVSENGTEMMLNSVLNLSTAKPTQKDIDDLLEDIQANFYEMSGIKGKAYILNMIELEEE